MTRLFFTPNTGPSRVLVYPAELDLLRTLGSVIVTRPVRWSIVSGVEEGRQRVWTSDPREVAEVNRLLACRPSSALDRVSCPFGHSGDVVLVGVRNALTEALRSDSDSHGKQQFPWARGEVESSALVRLGTVYDWVATIRALSPLQES